MRSRLFLIILLGFVSGVAIISAHAQEIGLSKMFNQLWTQDSPDVLGRAEALDRFGSSLASGDFNGDGYSDLAVGAPSEDHGLGKEIGGIVHVLYGLEGSTIGLTAAGNQEWSQDSPGIPGGVEYADRFGSVLAAGDFNNDGHDDLAIGVPEEDHGLTEDGGLVNILYGSTDGLTTVGNQEWSQDSPGIPGGVEYADRFGSALATGDFNGDGYADLAVGVPEEDFSEDDAGVVHILYGSAGGLSATDNQLWSQDSQDTVEIPGDTDISDRFGNSLISGDFNGDGYADLAIGVPGEDDLTAAADAGVVHILYGSADGLSAAGNQLWSQDSQDTVEIPGDTDISDRFGNSLISGDFNGDGKDDLAIGAPGEDDLTAAADGGVVHILYGTAGGLTAAGNQVWSQGMLYDPVNPDEDEVSDHFGDILASGDFNGDGYADLAIGVPAEDVARAGDASGEEYADAGVVHTLYGSASGLSADSSQLWSQVTPCVTGGIEPEDYFGQALTPGDFNGDGHDDLAIGVPEKDCADAGLVHVLYSNPHVFSELDVDGDQDLDGLDLFHLIDGWVPSETSSDIYLSWFAENYGTIRPPAGIGVSDQEMLLLLEEFAPRVWLNENTTDPTQPGPFYPSSVEWAFQYLERFENTGDCGKYWLRTIDALSSPSDHSLALFEGDPGSAPVYAFWARKPDRGCGYPVEETVDLVYYFFYPYNRGKPVNSISTTFGHHVGDWEHVTVRLRWHLDGQAGWTLKPSQMYLSAHGFGGAYDWETVPKVENMQHPVVYAARGSHGLWLEPGDHAYQQVCTVVCEWLIDECSAGEVWDTWEQMVTLDFYDPATNSGRGLGASVWPLWMGNAFFDPGDCGDETDPACGPIFRWGNPREGEVFGYWRLDDGPTGPVSKEVWSSDLR